MAGNTATKAAQPPIPKVGPLAQPRSLQQEGLPVDQTRAAIPPDNPQTPEKIGHLGLSNVTPAQLAEAQKITEIVCVQNMYNVAHRDDDGFIDNLAEQGIAYVPFFPLGGFSPLQSSALDAAAASLQASPMQIALAWLLHRSPNIMLIPGTSSVDHLRENLKAATLQLPPDTLAELKTIATKSEWKAH